MMRRLVLAFGLAIATLVGGFLIIPLALDRSVVVEGTVRDEYTGLPIPSAHIQMSSVSIKSDALGKYLLDGLVRGDRVYVEAPGYEGTSLSYGGQSPLQVILRPNTLSGRVRDSYSGQGVVSATISMEGLTATSNDEGHFHLEGVPRFGEIRVSAPSYESVRSLVGQQTQIELELRPNTLSGLVRDASTGEPISGATLFLAGGATARSDAEGGFRFIEVPSQPRLVAMAPGYRQAVIQVESTATQEVELRPLVVKGIYLSFHTVGWRDRRQHLFGLVDRTELNAVVMDVKGDQGMVNADVGVALSKEIGAEAGFADGLAEQLAWLKERDIYTIARIVVFKDGILGLKRPDLAVKESGSGDVYVDCEEQRWADPFNREVRDYNITIAEKAVRLGFDEVQFDYVRFPSDCINGKLVYSQDSNAESRVSAIAEFLELAAARLRPLGAYVAADTFGWTLLREDDLGIGQIIEQFAPHLDYLCPMVYPSTWGEGSLGLDYPAAHPYQVVLESLKRGRERMAAFPMVRIRPWLQDFDDYGPRKLTYGAAEVMAQRQAARDAGIESFMLWSPKAVYSEGAIVLEPP